MDTKTGRSLGNGGSHQPYSAAAVRWVKHAGRREHQPQRQEVLVLAAHLAHGSVQAMSDPHPVVASPAAQNRSFLLFHRGSVGQPGTGRRGRVPGLWTGEQA